jgi:hypothetical protein
MSPLQAIQVVVPHKPPEDLYVAPHLSPSLSDLLIASSPLLQNPLEYILDLPKTDTGSTNPPPISPHTLLGVTWLLMRHEIWTSGAILPVIHQDQGEHKCKFVALCLHLFAFLLLLLKKVHCQSEIQYPTYIVVD